MAFGRFFMLYIKPIINGIGNYYIEAEIRDRSRTDMIIDYLGTQYIIEMKICAVFITNVLHYIKRSRDCQEKNDK